MTGRAPVTGRRLALAIALLSLIFLGFVPALGHAQTLPLPVVIHADSGTVTVRAESGMERIARRVAARAPGVLARIHSDLEGLPRPEVVEIRLVKRGRDMTAASPTGRRAPPWASGVAYPDLGVLVVAARRGPQTINVENVVDHELAHLALGAALGERAPRWLHEGFAYQHSAEWSLERTRTLTGMVWFGNVIPLHELEAGFPQRESATDRAYAESYDFVAFLSQRGRYPDEYDDGDRWPFRRFLAEISAGMTVRDAAWAAYGASLDELFEEWRIDLRDRYMMLPIGMFAMGVWVLASLLLIIGYVRRRRRDRAILDRWEAEELAREAALAGALAGRSAPEATREAASGDPASVSASTSASTSY